MKRATSAGEHFYRHGLFSGYTAHRYGLSKPVSLAGGRSRHSPIFSTGKRRHVVSLIKDEMLEWQSSPFEKEGPLRQSLRAHLCLDGHGWERSDAEATFLVDRAIKESGHSRPSWDDGQPCATDSPDRCSWCGKEAHGGNGKASRFCSSICAKSALESREFSRRSEADRAFAAAKRALKRSKTTVRQCEECASPFQPAREKSKQRFCSFACGARSSGRRTPPGIWKYGTVDMACIYCGADFEARSKQAVYCSKRCESAWGRLKKGKAPTQMKTHVFDRYITRQVQPPAINGARFDFLLWQAGATITAQAAMPVPRITDALFAEA